MAARRLDISDLSLDVAVGDPAMDSLAERLRGRFDVDVVMITFIDGVSDRQVFKGLSAPRTRMCGHRATPLRQSLCHLVTKRNAPLRLDDVAADTSENARAAFRDLGVVSYLGMPVRDDDDTPIGALCLATIYDRRTWTEEEEADLQLFSEIVTNLIGQRLAEARLDRALANANSVSAARKQADDAFAAMSANLPGVTLRYALFEDGSDALEDLAGAYVSIWGFDWAELDGDASKLWSTVLEEDRPRVMKSLQRSATRNEPWRCEWRIVNRLGERRVLRAYGTPQPLDGGIGTIWSMVVLDMTRIAEDGDRLTRVA